MTTTTHKHEMFAPEPHHHVVKDILLVTLVAAITAGFLAHAWSPSAKVDRAAITPAVLFAQK